MLKKDQSRLVNSFYFDFLVDAIGQNNYYGQFAKN